MVPGALQARSITFCNASRVRMQSEVEIVRRINGLDGVRYQHVLLRLVNKHGRGGVEFECPWALFDDTSGGPHMRHPRRIRVQCLML
jgi:hypothetical protein